MAVALAGCLWAVFGGMCPACAELAGLGLPLGWLGAAYYGTLLVLLAVAGGSPYVRLGVVAAGGVHLSLLGQLIARQTVCVPCYVAAAGAIAGALLVALALDRSQVYRSLMVAIAGFILTNVGLDALRSSVDARLTRTAMIAAQEAVKEKRADVPDRGAIVVVYSIEGCEACEEFEKVQQQIAGDFHLRVFWDEREAPPGLAAPTVVVVGKRNTLFAFPPTLEEMRQAVRLATGEARPGAAPEPGISVPAD